MYHAFYLELSVIVSFLPFPICASQVNVSNLVLIVTELFGENVVRGRGILARAIITAHAASPTFSHVYAALVAIINTKFPQNGELILKRLIIAFRKGFKRYERDLWMIDSDFERCLQLLIVFPIWW